VRASIKASKLSKEQIAWMAKAAKMEVRDFRGSLGLGRYAPNELPTTLTEGRAMCHRGANRDHNDRIFQKCQELALTELKQVRDFAAGKSLYEFLPRCQEMWEPFLKTMLALAHTSEELEWLADRQWLPDDAREKITAKIRRHAERRNLARVKEARSLRALFEAYQNCETGRQADKIARRRLSKALLSKIEKADTLEKLDRIPQYFPSSSLANAKFFRKQTSLFKAKIASARTLREARRNLKYAGAISGELEKLAALKILEFI